MIESRNKVEPLAVQSYVILAKTDRSFDLCDWGRSLGGISVKVRGQQGVDQDEELGPNEVREIQGRKDGQIGGDEFLHNLSGALYGGLGVYEVFPLVSFSCAGVASGVCADRGELFGGYRDDLS